jgi:hypothetical protein
VSRSYLLELEFGRGRGRALGLSGQVEDLYVVPDTPVVSYLTPLTGLTAELLAEKGVSLEEALATLKEKLPSTAVLAGQNIAKDVQWCKLKEGEDFASMIDLAGLLKVWDSRRGSHVRALCIPFSHVFSVCSLPLPLPFTAQFVFL